MEAVLALFSGFFVRWKVVVNENLRIKDHAFTSKLLQTGHKLEKWKWCHDLLTWLHRYVFFDVVVFFLSSLVRGPSFTLVSLLALYLWQLLFIIDLTRILGIGNIPVWYQISGEWRDLGTPNLVWMSLIKSHVILENNRFTVSTIFESLR